MRRVWSPIRIRSDGGRISEYRLATTILEPGGSTASVAIVLHGGSSNRQRLSWFGSALVDAGFRVVLFDHSGHGDSPAGVRSLQARLVEARRVVDEHVREGDHLTVVGFSMGGYTAIELCDLIPERVANLALIVPAAYGDQAWRTPFGPQFHDVISAPKSWATASVFFKLAKVHIPVLLVLADDDRVIPTGISNRYASIVAELPDGEVEVLEGASHAVSAWLLEHPLAAAKIVAKIRAASVGVTD